MYNAMVLAVEYISRGFQLIEVEPRGKKPVAMNWSKKFASVEDFALHPTANIGIVTGMVSGICVIDFDDPTLFDLYIKKFGLNTTMVKRGTHRHLYFKVPSYCLTLSSHPNYYKGLDFSADGRFIIAPGSRHPSGDVYQLVGSFDYMIEFQPDFINFIGLAV